jgi:hypothetical protein
MRSAWRRGRRSGRHGSDGGYDIVLLERAGDETRQASSSASAMRPIDPWSVGIVRQLLGVQLVLGIPLAKLVTSAHSTESAVRTAQRAWTGESGYQLRLLRCSE